MELAVLCLDHRVNYYYFCPQEVEEETGSAGEQPVSNKLPALRSNKLVKDNCFHVVLYLLLLSLYG